jgi:copper chaperone CopZ
MWNFQRKTMKTQKNSSILFSVLVGVLVVAVIGGVTFMNYAPERSLELRVSGMSCQGCVANVKQSLEKLEGVKEVKIEFPYVDPNKKPLTEDEKFDEKTGRPLPEEPKIGRVVVTYVNKNAHEEKAIREIVALAGDYQVDVVK